MVVTQTELLEPALLDRVWWRWLEDVIPSKSNYIKMHLQERINFKMSYSGESRATRITQDFEQWLYDQGAEVRQVKGKRYLQFVDPSSATIFAMRWL